MPCSCRRAAWITTSSSLSASRSSTSTVASTSRASSTSGYRGGSTSATDDGVTPATSDRVPFRVPVQLEPHDLGVVWVTDEEHTVAALHTSTRVPGEPRAEHPPRHEDGGRAEDDRTRKQHVAEDQLHDRHRERGGGRSAECCRKTRAAACAACPAARTHRRRRSAPPRIRATHAKRADSVRS